ncbi:hypothetical protein E8E12_003952 [Didymella heteroderae]|uniref:Uncharacterized protein n=1 Tax=Didymella heteroderae TaxID=1769908 RepID=A0A9P5BZB8_9PLEO|nr:hypothetical protein E8E12_003952 [Didymella heteroderae]
MSVLDFLCDVRFHKSYVLPPNPDTGRHAPFRVSYADYGDPESNAVVLFCGALMGSRFCYSLLDQLAKAYNVRIIHPDRPGIGGTQPVDLDRRIQTWLGWSYRKRLMSASLLLGLVHQLRATDLLPAPVVGKFVSVVKFVNDNVTPLAGLSGGFVQGIRESIQRSSSNPFPGSAPAPIPLTPTTLSMRRRGTSLFSYDEKANLDDDLVVDELRRHVTAFLFAGCMDGIKADVQLFLRKPRSVTWCSSSIFWSDFDYAVPLVSKMIDEEGCVDGVCRRWTVDAFHAQTDAMVGERVCGKEKLHAPYLPNRNSYRYWSNVVEGTEHNYLMDPAFGASEAWLKRVRDSFPLPIESKSEVDGFDEELQDIELQMVDDDASFSSTRPIIEPRRRYAKHTRCFIEEATVAISLRKIDRPKAQYLE